MTGGSLEGIVGKYCVWCSWQMGEKVDYKNNRKYMRKEILEGLYSSGQVIERLIIKKHIYLNH